MFVVSCLYRALRRLSAYDNLSGLRTSSVHSLAFEIVNEIIEVGQVSMFQLRLCLWSVFLVCVPWPPLMTHTV